MIRIEATSIENDRNDPNTRWTLISRSLEELVTLINGDWVDTENNWLRVMRGKPMILTSVTKK